MCLPMFAIKRSFMGDIFDIFKKISAERDAAASAPIKFIVAGLGNPGDKYHNTRHNAGFMFMDYLAEKNGVKINRAKFNALIGEANISGNRVLLLKPQTYMNNSGEAVRDAAAFYKIPEDNIIIVYDDVSLPAGKQRIRLRGSDGGHNGIKSIIYHLETDAFPRIKIGVGTPPPERDMVGWVLGTIPAAEREDFFKSIENSYKALELILSGDAARAMNLYN